MGLPVVTVASGGLPVADNTAKGVGMAVTEATAGIPVTKVASGGLGVVYVTATGGAAGAEAAAFLARTSGLNATHTNAYTALINGLVTDGIWSKLDMLHVYATQDSTTALLNLVSASYGGTPHGAVPFTADRGFTGEESTGNFYINTNFNQSTATSPKFVQNSAHISIWSLSSGVSYNSAMGAENGTTGTIMALNLQSNGNTYYRVNGTNAFYAGTGMQGHFLANRSTSSSIQGYKNGTNTVTDNANTSVAVMNLNFYTLSDNINGVANGSGFQASMASIGSSLSSTEVTTFYNRLRTYMTAVGVP